MIPKVIHYCWFGRNPLPKSAKKCIASWRKFFPDYEIKEWNEDNFDVNIIPYTRQAYEAEKYAFVSDYARFWILYNHGGVYFDTDVEVIRPMDDIIERGAFMGVEQDKPLSIAPGLGLAVDKGRTFYRDILANYHNLPFYTEEGRISSFTMVPMVTKMLVDSGLSWSGRIEFVNDTYIYPKDYFNPMDSLTGKIKITSNTRSIHRYTASWLPVHKRKLLKIKRWIRFSLHNFTEIVSK